MFVIKLEIILFFVTFHGSNGQRRIETPSNLTTSKTYVVYLLKAAELSSKNYLDWLCGGALVTTDFIITSAACVEDVNYMYAIAGYDKYIFEDDLKKDECIKQTKKKVIFTCVPVSYNFDSALLQMWSYIDIALVKVESPYDFTDPIYEELCSYTPSIIPINYDPKYQEADIDAMIFGWGHRKRWRKHGDSTVYNSPNLVYAPVLIMDKELCKAEYEVYPNMTYIIDQFMICTLEPGKINDRGQAVDSFDGTSLIKTCKPKDSAPNQEKLSYGQDLPVCTEEDNNNNNNNKYEDYDIQLVHGDYTRRKNENHLKNRTIRYHSDTPYDMIKRAAAERSSNNTRTRRNGICQNDHGGPLVTWIGTKEVLIGIASVFKVNDKSECIGPYLYTSTQCNGAFIDCVIRSTEQLPYKKDSVTNFRRSVCDSVPSVKGFDAVHNHIAWKDHPDGPAHNENYENQQRYKNGEFFPGQEDYGPAPYAPNEQYAMEQPINQENNKPEGEEYPYGDDPENYRFTGTQKVARSVKTDESGIQLRPQRPLYASN